MVDRGGRGGAMGVGGFAKTGCFGKLVVYAVDFMGIGVKLMEWE